MRTSNKIILGIFLAPLVAVTAINLTLYAKYKSGSYVSMKAVQDDRFTRIKLSNTNKIAVYGLSNFSIIPSDSMKLEIEKNGHGHLHYTISADSIVIHGDSTIQRANGKKEVERSYEDVNLFLPAGVVLFADNTDVSVKGNKDSTKAASYQFSIVNDATLKVVQEGDDSTHVYFKTLNIQASKSAGIELTAHTKITDLTLSLIMSAFTDNGASIDKLTIASDKVSNISLKGDNLNKVNAAKQP